MKTALSNIITLLCFFVPLSGFAQSSTLITTFTNPTPAAFDGFGGPMAAVGTDRIVIGASRDNTAGASESGVAYLFRNNGALLTTFFNPTTAAS